MNEQTTPGHSPPARGRGAKRWTRRGLLKKGGIAGLFATLFGGGLSLAAKVVDEVDEHALSDAVGDLFQDHYQQMTQEEIQAALGRIQRKTERQHGVKIEVGNEQAQPGVVFGFALNLSRCTGVRECVKACVVENNLSRSPQIEYIRVLELDRGTLDLNRSDHYYEGESVPKPDKIYLPMQCVQCNNPPCVKACPVNATWLEPDGIVVTDYDWCIGSRACMTACPYWARRFNWAEPELPKAEINRRTHILGNRPREKGVVEKCTNCIQRTRNDRQPACVEACPTGARIFGNLLDPDSEIRYILENKRVFRLKEEAGCDPKFWYFFD
ncbi:MAG: 4Fe-4S dicluster domain-containing protein [SAR324 cluster bacterium]|nr:4Fe-4S dicluster domain-containing protein [SAR324 cluster bacterium]